MRRHRLPSRSAQAFCAALATAWILLSAPEGAAQAPRILLQEVVSNLAQPVFLTHSRDGSGRHFIVEQDGRILVLQPSASTPTVFLDIRSRVLAGGERGLLGLTFHPQYAANRRFFVNYTRQPDGATVIAEFRTSDFDPQVADPASESVLLVIAQPFSNHNGGMIEFGPDNFLYIAMGDGGSANDPDNRAQNRGELLGKILRIDVDQPAAPARYSSPESNPFAGRISGRDEIYALGLRNPWRFSFDRLTGDLYVGDVGQGEREEIDIIVRGGNYGWRAFEGARCTGLGPPPCGAQPLFIAPIAEYENGTQGCSVTGGYVYRGSQQSLPFGAYVFGDYCTGDIFMFHDGVQSTLLDTPLNISSFGEDAAGEIYVVGHGGTIHRITNPDAAASTQFPFSIPAHGAATLQSIGAGQTLTTGSARIQAGSSFVPQGAANLTFRRQGVLVSETSVPAVALLQSARIFATLSQETSTAVAIVNPNTQNVTIEFHFTAVSGERLHGGSVTLPAGGKISVFLHENPFAGPTPFSGAFTFRSTGLPVAALALIGRTNARGDFLMTALPVVNLDQVQSAPAWLPYWAHGGEWDTEFVLVNASSQLSSGTLHMISPVGRVVGTLRYRLPPEAALVLRPAITESTVRAGSARITPEAGPPPAGVAIFRQAAGSVLVTEAGASTTPAGLEFQGPVETSAAVQSGFAIVNTWPAEVTATVSLIRSNGEPVASTQIRLRPLGQAAFFLEELPALAPRTPFQGTLRITAPTHIAVTGLRRRSNERGELLVSAPVFTSLSQRSGTAEAFFPHWVLGGGFDTDFILINGHDVPTAGTLHFSDDSGNPLPLLLP